MRLMKSLEERIIENAQWRRKFAWFPTSLPDGSVIWLESYERMYEYLRIAYFGLCFCERRRAVEATTQRGTNSGGPGAPTSKEEVFNGIQ